MNIKSDEFDRLAERMTWSRDIMDGDMLHVFDEGVVLPNGVAAHRELIRHRGAVAVVPITDDGAVIVERQYRYPIGRITTEIPAGKLNDKTEDRLSAAKRELREETGLTADTWELLGEYLPAAAYCDEKITIYTARGLHKGDQDLDFDELLDIYAVPLEELVTEVMEGRILDGKTQVAILKTALKYR